MHTRGMRRLRDGREVDIGRNDGLRKLCRCGRRKRAKCAHAWHFSFQWEGQHHRFSLERHIGKKLTKTEAEVEAERLRTAIRAGEFHETPEPIRQPKPQHQAPMTFRQFAEEWRARRGYQLVRPRDNDSRLKLIYGFVLPGTEPPMTFGEKPVADITTGDIESYVTAGASRSARRSRSTTISSCFGRCSHGASGSGC
jgi:hypothetical protein